MITVLRSKADLYLDKTSIFLFIISIFSSLIKLDINVGIALISYFFINKKIISKYSLRLKQIRQFIFITFITLIFDIIWIAIWSQGYQKYDDTSSGSIRFAFVMTIIGIVVKIFYCILLISYWNDNDWYNYNLNDKTTPINNDTFKAEIELQHEETAKKWDMNELGNKEDEVEDENENKIEDATLNQDADQKYINYEDENDGNDKNNDTQITQLETTEQDEELGSNLNVNTV